MNPLLDSKIFGLRKLRRNNIFAVSAAPHRPPLAYRQLLFQHTTEMFRQLRPMGLGRHDRVGIDLAHEAEQWAF